MSPSLRQYMEVMSQSFYHYSGSLTTPPCSEIVTWLVMKNPLKCSNAQVAKMKSYLTENYRRTKEVNNRKLYTVEATLISFGTSVKVSTWLLGLILLALTNIF